MKSNNHGCMLQNIKNWGTNVTSHSSALIPQSFLNSSSPHTEICLHTMYKQLGCPLSTPLEPKHINGQRPSSRLIYFSGLPKVRPHQINQKKVMIYTTCGS